MNHHSEKFILIYLFAACLLSLYGTEVCAYIDSLLFLEIFPIFSGSLIIFFFLRTQFFKKQVSLYRAFWIECLGWLIAGLAVSIVNAFLFKFPLGSGLKVLVGYCAMGLQSAVYFALLVEKDQMSQGVNHQTVKMNLRKSVSIPTRLYVLVLLSHILTASIICLILLKDYYEIVNMADQSDLTPFTSMITEVILCFVLFLLTNSMITKVYSDNLKTLLKNQLDSMDLISAGNLDVVVPVLANHEMGLIGVHTNTMVERLRHRKQLQSIFDKLVSPEVAQRILSSEAGDQLGGKEIEATVMFMDIRNFTSMSEECSARDIVRLLNHYFSVVVEIIHAHHGVVDKFIGDAVMAVFGFDETRDGSSATHAVQASLEIKQALFDINQALKEDNLPEIANGIGLHYGEMISGNIGSPNRLEYTVIGDTVNIGARLESTCKALKTWLCISNTVYDQLGSDLQGEFIEVGEVSLKGKSSEVVVFKPRESSTQDQ